MKHLATIQSEFLKDARNWDDLTLEEQKGYLKRHPKSKRKLTAKPLTHNNQIDFGSTRRENAVLADKILRGNKGYLLTFSRAKKLTDSKKEDHHIFRNVETGRFYPVSNKNLKKFEENDDMKFVETIEHNTADRNKT